MSNIDPTKAKEILLKDRRAYLEKLNEWLTYYLSQKAKGNFTLKDWEDFAVESLQTAAQEIRRVNGAIQYFEECERGEGYPRFRCWTD